MLLHLKPFNWRNESTVILDATSKEQFEAGHIPGAINIPVLQFFQDGRIKTPKEIKDTFVQSGVDTTKPLIFSCNSGV